MNPSRAPRDQMLAWIIRELERLAESSVEDRAVVAMLGLGQFCVHDLEKKYGQAGVHRIVQNIAQAAGVTLALAQVNRSKEEPLRDPQDPVDPNALFG